MKRLGSSRSAFDLDQARMRTMRPPKSALTYILLRCQSGLSHGCCAADPARRKPIEVRNQAFE